MMKFIKNLIKKVIKKSVTAEVEDTIPATETESNPKKAFWKFIIQTIINILAAVLTALGTTSCLSL